MQGDSTVPYGYCHCGCGERTKLAEKTDRQRGWEKGKPFRYIRDHGTRKYADPKQKHQVYRSKPEVREREGAYYRINHERIKAQAIAWQKANPERRRAHYLMRMSANGRHTGADIIQMYDDQQGLCAYCETPLFGDYHVDHMFPLSRGGTNYWHNLAIVCPKCNLTKHAKTTEEFFNVMP